MTRILKCLVLFAAFAFADECYVMPHLTNIEKPRRNLVKKNCAIVSRAMTDMDYYAQAIGREAELIVDEPGSTTVGRYFYSTQDYGYHLYLLAQFNGLNPIGCSVTTLSGPECGALEWIAAAVAVRDYYLGKK